MEGVSQEVWKSIEPKKSKEKNKNKEKTQKQKKNGTWKENVDKKKKKIWYPKV